MPLKILLIFIVLLSTSQSFSRNFTQSIAYAKAEIKTMDIIQKIDEETSEPYSETNFTLKILSGEFEGQEKNVLFQGDDTMPEETKYKPGDIIYIGFNTIGMKDGTDTYIALYDIDNSNGIIVMALLLTIAIFGIGRIKGLFSMIALLITISLVFLIFIPLTLKGFSPLLGAIIVSMLSIFITIPVITGFTRKTLSAIAGVTCGIIIATLLALLSGWVLHLAGIVDHGMIKVYYLAKHQLNLRDLALSSMIIGALGAIMDVAISISSTTAEIYTVNPKIEKKQAILSSFAHGKDILAAMVNTLVLAYVGSSLSIILIIYMKFDSKMPFNMILSHNPILVEIVKSFVGSIGMFITIPATAIIAVALQHTYYNSKK